MEHPYAIRRDSNGLPVFYSAATGRKLGQPLGGWVNQPDEALQFARERDASEFVDCFLSSQRASIHVVRV